VLVRSLMEQVFGARPETELPTLMPARLGSPPPVCSSEPVPASFLHLRGDHAPRPGAGRGFGKERLRAA
jgi:hypothetical protein